MSIVIGIDPGKQTGIAICNDGKLVNVYETNFWGAIEAINLHDDALVVVEKPDTTHVWHNQAKTRCAIQKTGVNVGSVIREAQLIIEYLVLNSRKHLVQNPKGKIDAVQFKRLTGWTGRTNQHMRDAGCLVYGLRIKNAQ